MFLKMAFQKVADILLVVIMGIVFLVHFTTPDNLKRRGLLARRFLTLQVHATVGSNFEAPGAASTT
jgi:hypothetical protein